jgi:long-subunit acyl-CoA synthetase (AMP-forming)
MTLFLNKSLGELEQIRRFGSITEEWTPQTGKLSPTLNLKRNPIAEHYKDIIGEIYFSCEKDSNVLLKIKNGISGILKNLPKF